MSCAKTEIWLLQSESLRADACPDPSVLRHLNRCRACQRLASLLGKLEKRWREVPLPADVDDARQRFLARLAREKAPAMPAATAPAAPRWKLAFPARPRLAVAASLFLALGLGIWLLVAPNRSAASENVVDRLLEWNLALSREPSAEKRRQMYETQVPILKHALEVASLSPDDRALATNLMDNGHWLATADDDPLEEANRFSTIADHLVERMQQATNQGNHPETDQLAQRYSVLTQRGINANLDDVVEAPVLTSKQQEKLERSVAQSEQRLQTLQAILPHVSPKAATQIKKAVEVTSKHPKPAPNHKPKPKSGPNK
jgi:hypothetical protein